MQVAIAIGILALCAIAGTYFYVMALCNLVDLHEEKKIKKQQEKEKKRKEQLRLAAEHVEMRRKQETERRKRLIEARRRQGLQKPLRENARPHAARS